MRNVLSKIGRMTAQSFIAAMFVLSVVSMAAFALTFNPATIAPRDFNTQQTGYIRLHVKSSGNGIVANGIACSGAATASTCSVKFGAVPGNAFLVRITQQIVTNFNGGTTDTIALGTASGSGNIMTAASVHTGAGAISSPSFTSGGSGTLLTTGIQQSGTNGGYDLYVTYAYGAAVATAGEAVWVIEYFSPNDGDCVATPMGTSPTSC